MVNNSWKIEPPLDRGKVLIVTPYATWATVKPIKEAETKKKWGNEVILYEIEQYFKILRDLLQN